MGKKANSASKTAAGCTETKRQGILKGTKILRHYGGKMFRVRGEKAAKLKQSRHCKTLSSPLEGERIASRGRNDDAKAAALQSRLSRATKQDAVLTRVLTSVRNAGRGVLQPSLHQGNRGVTLNLIQGLSMFIKSINIDRCRIKFAMTVSCAKRTEKNFSPFTYHFSREGKRYAFTLAEVLITLGIIGVVAALTLPSVIEKHQKQVTETRLKAFYSVMSQAFERAVSEYGYYSEWDTNRFGENLTLNGDGEKQLQWLEKYLLPYIKTTETYSTGKYAVVGLPNGSGFSNYNSLYFFCVEFSDCKKKTEAYNNSRTRFIFKMGNNGFEPYDCGWQGGRDELFVPNSCNHVCSKKSGGMCAKLIQFDGWQIKDDYPW